MNFSRCFSIAVPSLPDDNVEDGSGESFVTEGSVKVDLALCEEGEQDKGGEEGPTICQHVDNDLLRWWGVCLVVIPVGGEAEDDTRGGEVGGVVLTDVNDSGGGSCGRPLSRVVEEGGLHRRPLPTS